MILSDSLSFKIWKILLILLPVSSFTMLSNLMGGTNVAPLSLIPMGILLVDSFLPFFIKSGFKLPYHLKPLLLFFLIGLLSTLFVSIRDVPTFQDFSLQKEILEAIVTFIIGVGFYIVTIYMVNDEEKLQSTIYWISLAGIIIMAVSFLQVGIWMVFKSYPNWLHGLNHFFSSSGKLFEHRAHGLSFEPSWLAHQLNILFIPLWMGLSISGVSVFKKKIFNKIQVEKVLFVLSILTLFITYSRIGWITTILLTAFVVMRMLNTWVEKISKTEKDGKIFTTRKQKFLRLGIWLGLIIGLIIVLVLAGIVMTKLEPRMAEFFNFQRLKEKGILNWASQLSIGERIIYWMAAYGVFQLFPFLGAGFGVPGFFFLKTVPDFGSELLDINALILKKTLLPNAKNLWMRLLAETGIIGFSVFVSWVFLHLRNAIQLEKKANSPLLKSMGLIGKLVVLAFVIEGISLDSFALPYYWVAMGLVAASSLIADQASVKIGANIESTKVSNSSENSFSTGKSSFS